MENPRAARVLDALGVRTRRDILALLETGPLPVGRIAAKLPISRPAVSKHLKVLEGAGLVSHQAVGTSNVFYLRPDGFQEVRAYLDRFWDLALANFQKLVQEEEGTDAQ